MSSTKPIVVVVGITGMLGAKIVDQLLVRGDVHVRATVRDIGKVDQLKDFVSRGVEIVQADISKPETLDSALAGATAVISSVNNEHSLIVDGQTNLLRAAERAGTVKRFIPSDFAVDYRKLDAGDNYNMDMRKEFLPILEASTVPYTLILQGAFTDLLIQPFFSPYNQETGEFTYWGDGEQLIDFTTTEDTAKYTASAVLDPKFENKAVTIAGEQANFKQIAAIVSKLIGKSIEPKSSGTVEELVSWIAEKKKTAEQVYEYLGQQYQFVAVSGKAKLDPIMNDQFPSIVPQSIESFLTGKL
jgi:uncharacterized protein YbjT (DUF2867 family)